MPLEGSRPPHHKAAESKALLDFLYAHQQRPEFQVWFRWTENAIALWNNRCTQHFALWDYRPSEPVHSDLRISRRHD